MIINLENLLIGVSDKVLMPWLEGKEYMSVSNENEAVAVAAGYYIATGKTATAFMSADGFMNTLNFLTSWIIPENIKIHLVISIGRTEKPHRLATELTKPFLVMLLAYDESKSISYEFVEK